MSTFSPQLTHIVKPMAQRLALAGGYPPDMDVFEFRRHNLASLVASLEKRGTTKRKDQAQRLGGMSSSYLSQLLGGKKMGEDVARKIEAEVGQPRGWMDQDHRDVPGEAVPAIRDAPTIESLMNELGPRLKKAPPHIRELVGQSLLKYSTNPEDGESIARAIRSLLEPYA